MNAEALLKLYERIADAPDAVERLRRFILDLALSGRLLSGFYQKYPTVRLGNIAQLQNGYAFKSEWFGSVGIRLVRNVNVGHGILNWSEEVRLSVDQAKQFSRFELCASDIVLSLDRPFIVSGTKVARVKECDLPALLLQRVGRFILQPELTTDYLFLWINSPMFAGQIDPGRSNGVPHISSKQVEAAALVLPPLDEQHRIVAKVDELMALCDRLEAARAEREATRDRLAAASLARLNTPDPNPETFKAHARFAISTALPALTTRPDQIKQLRQTIINLAVRGKLVDQDETDEPAVELLNRVRKEKRRLGIKPLQISENLAIPLPVGWVSTTLGAYAIDVFTGPFGSALHQHEYIEGGIPLINPSHMRGDRIVPDPRVSVSPTTADRLSSYRLEAGDIVMARRGEVGRAARVEAHQQGWLCGTGSFFLRFTPEVDRTYLLLLFRTSELRAFLAGEAVGTTMVNLNHGILKRAPLHVPPLAEQNRIVNKVNDLMQLCDQLEASLESGSAARRRLLDALLHEALAPSKEIEEAA